MLCESSVFDILGDPVVIAVDRVIDLSSVPPLRWTA